jgi:hypothetical protein
MPIVGSFAGASARAYGLGASRIAESDLRLISTQSFTTASSVTFDNVFSNDYVQYKILTEATGTTLAGINFQFRTSVPSTYTTANYRWQKFQIVNTDITNSGRSTGQTSWQNALGAVDNAQGYASFLEVYNPFQTVATTGLNQHSYSNVGTLEIRAFAITVTDSFAGFLFAPSAGTITGSVSVFGYYKGA